MRASTVTSGNKKMKSIIRLVFLSAIFAFVLNTQFYGQVNDFIISGSNQNSIMGGVAFDGTNYLVGLAGDSIGNSDLTVQFISQQGELLGERISLGENGSAPVLAFDGSNYLIIWGDRFVRFLDGGEDAGMTNIYGRLMSPDGNFVGSKFTIVNDAYIKGCVSGKLQFNAGKYFFIYREDDGSDDYGPVYGQMISTAGSLSGSAFQISDASAGDLDMAFDGSNYLVAFWIDATQVYGQFVSNSGTLIGNDFPIDNSSNASDNPVSVAYGDSKYLVAFHDHTLADGWNLKAHFVSTSGTVDPNIIMIADSTHNPMIPLMAFDGSNFLTTWINMNDKQIEGQYITTSGEPYNSEFVIFDYIEGVLPIGGVSSFSGNKYLSICTRVAWNNQKGTDEDCGIFGKFVANSNGMAENINNIINTKLYPNPAKDVITVFTDDIDVELNIYDLNGKIVKTVAGINNENKISISDLSNGIYLIEIKSKDFTERQKIVIQK